MRLQNVALQCLTLILLLPLLPPDSAAAQSARLKVAFIPEDLGGRTTMVFGFRITSPPGKAPPPLSTISLRYPANIGIITSGLGLETCTPLQLEAKGRCPINSLMGYGNALMELPIGPEIIQERAEITTWMAPINHGHLALLFYAEGKEPIYAGLIFTGEILDAPPPFGGQLATDVPAIETLPGASDAATVQMTSTIGPMNVTYYTRFRGRRIAYHPNGLRLPKTCPHGGFPFAATFTFLDGSHTLAKTGVPCPRT